MRSYCLGLRVEDLRVATVLVANVDDQCYIPVVRAINVNDQCCCPAVRVINVDDQCKAAVRLSECPGHQCRSSG